jgi:hypothetical protein
MITHSGAKVFPDWDKRHTGDIPDLADIARGLSRQSRWCGQTEHFFSVLAHTFVVASIMPEEHRIHGLLHDAPEAIVSDVPTPWKHEATKADEAWLTARLYEAHAIELPEGEALDALHAADYAALCAEAHVLGHAAADEYWPMDGWSTLEIKAAIEVVDMVAGEVSLHFLIETDAAVEAYAQAIVAASETMRK